MQPLDGVDVLDFTQSIAGPTCTQTLSVLGANVVKVEPPNGDAFRPLVDGAMFASCNRGKRSISIDLKADRGVELARDLATTADVVVESFRPGVMDRFGLGYEDVAADNPDVVYCSITGFGQDGPYEQYPAYDPVAQAMSGLMSITGQPDGEPVRLGTSAIDINTGMTAAMLIMGGLMQRNANDGGEYFDVSLFDVATTWMSYWIAYYTSTGDMPQRSGSGLFGFAPYGAFEAAEGEPFYLATASQKLWRRLCSTLDREDLLEDERFDTQADRWDNREALHDELDPEFRSYDRRDLVEKLAGAGVPCGPLQYTDELVEDDPHVEDREMLIESRNQWVGEDCRTTRMPFRDSDGPIDDASPPPSQGEHTRAVLEEFGYDDDVIADLLEDEVLVES